MTASDIGVVVPVFNRAQTVLTTLDSIARQTLRPRRLVVVDDGSNDDTAATVSAWLEGQQFLADVQFLRQRNLGVSVARNRGLALLDDCRCVAFLDSDDEWPQDFLERTRAALHGSNGGVAATCDRHSIAAEGTVEHDDLSTLPHNPILWMLQYGAGIASCTLFCGERVRQLGGFPPALRAGEDAALFLRLSLRGDWLHVPGAPVTFNRQLPRALGEEASLSAKYRDSYRRWALVYEDFLSEQRSRCSGFKDKIRPIMAKIWLLAGEELEFRGDLAGAQQCFGRSLRWNAWNRELWHRYVKGYRRAAKIRNAPVATRRWAA